MSDALLKVTNAGRCFASEAETVWAVREVSLTARAGEFVCIYGASGSGKSTLLNLIAGLDVADEGEVVACSQNLGKLDEDARARLRLDRIGVVFQEHNLIEEFTAAENVALPLEVLGLNGREAYIRANEELRRVDLAGLGGRYPRQLSGGQRQRVGVARALAGDRAILLADEPTGALDSRASEELFKLIRVLCDQGVAAIVCSHDPGCRKYADSSYEMVDGSLSIVTASLDR